MGIITDSANRRYALVPNNPLLNITGAFTYSYWFKSGNTGAIQRIFSKFDATPASGYAGVQTTVAASSGGGYPFLYIGYAIPDTYNGLYVVHGDTNVNDGNWHHLAFVWPGSAQTPLIYTDGISNTITLVQGATPPTAVAYTSRGLGFGLVDYNPAGFGPQYYDVHLFDCRIYNQALGAAWVKIMYEGRGPADRLPFNPVGQWLLDQGPEGSAATGANSLTDIGVNGLHATPYNSPLFEAVPMKLY